MAARQAPQLRIFRNDFDTRSAALTLRSPARRRASAPPDSPTTSHASGQRSVIGE